MKDYFWIVGYETLQLNVMNDITLNIGPILMNGFQYTRILTILKFYVNHNTLILLLLQKYYYFCDILFTA